MLARGLHLREQARHVVVLEDLRAGADREPPAAQIEAHRALELPEVRVHAVAVTADRHELARLVGGHHQRAAELVEDLGQVRAVDAAQRRGLRRRRVDGSVGSVRLVRRPARSTRGRARRARRCDRARTRSRRAVALRLSSSRRQGRGRRSRAAATPANSQIRSISGAGSSRSTAWSTTHHRTGGSRSRSASRIRVAIAHCSATISASGLPARLRHSGVSSSDHGGPSQPGRSGWRDRARPTPRRRACRAGSRRARGGR